MTDMTKDTGRKHYRAYLLRLWQTNVDEAPPPERAVWRASLERPRTGERRGFASLDDLFAFLQRETSAAYDAENDGNRAQ